MLRNLCRIFSRQLVLQEVLGSRDIAMALYTYRCEYTITTIKAAVVPAGTRTKEDVAGNNHAVTMCQTSENGQDM